ncbi:MAG: TetR/AcrR family transcriptional regulator [Phycisphaeraceae bacterium]|nr:TetR/AcrR family transcriptional regulator [Phycisphaeraceae bacterium]
MSDPETTWQRARSPEQIAERRADILRAAGELIDEGGLDSAGLNAIARRVGLSKANLYRYFESREAILLDLTLAAFHSWCDQVIQELSDLAGGTRVSIETVASTLAKRYAQRPRLGILVHALPGIIEHNISLETAIDFKANAFEQLQQIAKRLSDILPELSEPNATQFLWLWSTAASGAWPHCHPHPIIQQAINHLGMEAMAKGYEETIHQFAVSLLREQINHG